jgi:Zn-dependent M32 family carboxypeptidase
VRPLILAAALAWACAWGEPSALEQAEVACARDLKACAHRDELLVREKAERDRLLAEQEAKRQEELRRQHDEVAAAEASEEAEQNALRKKCGKDFNRVRVGMKFARVEQCAGPLELRAETATYKIYEGSGGAVRVEHGTVTRVVYSH